jgi:PIN domain nuclease of toxin-antitoxin system
MLNADNSIYVSLITFWEVSIKYSLGKIGLKDITPEELPAVSKEAGFETLILSEKDVASFYKLPRHNHKDPFDRLIIWQAIHNDLVLLSKDRQIADYKEFGLRFTWWVRNDGRGALQFFSCKKSTGDKKQLTGVRPLLTEEGKKFTGRIFLLADKRKKLTGWIFLPADERKKFTARFSLNTDKRKKSTCRIFLLTDKRKKLAGKEKKSTAEKKCFTGFRIWITD